VPNIRNGSVVANTTGIGPLPLRLADVEVLFNNIAAPILAVWNMNNQEAVTVQVPYEVQPGTASVTVRVSGSATTIDNVPVHQLSPGIFEAVDAQNRRYAIVQRPDGSFVTPENPAQRGENLRLFVTGLGQTNPAVGTNRAGADNARVNTTIIAGVNDAGATFVSARPSTTVVGLYEVVFQIPTDFATGAYRPVSLGVVAPNGQTIYSNGSLIAAVQ
jgi:uncharacterized protein (TIGR03437 family)